MEKSLHDALKEYDLDFQQAIREGVEVGKKPEEVITEVKERFRPRYMSILAQYNDASVFRIPFPSGQ